MKKAPSDGGGPWKGRFRPPRFNKLSEGLARKGLFLYVDWA